MSEITTPRELFLIPPGTTSMSAANDLKRFLFPIPVERNGPQGLTVMLNWTSALKQ